MMPISFDATITHDLDQAESREWLEANGLGGWASGTIAGCHTRRYHGLLVAATRPPVGRMVLLSKLAETVVDVAERFAPCGFDRLVVTKLDEAIKLGVVLDVLSRVQTELSFVMTGQEIPRDIEVADSARLASLILGEETL